MRILMYTDMAKIIMNEDSHVPRGPDTGRERVLTQVRSPGRVAGGHARAQGDGDGSRWL